MLMSYKGRHLRSNTHNMEEKESFIVRGKQNLQVLCDVSKEHGKIAVEVKESVARSIHDVGLLYPNRYVFSLSRYPLSVPVLYSVPNAFFLVFAEGIGSDLSVCYIRSSGAWEIHRL